MSLGTAEKGIATGQRRCRPVSLAVEMTVIDIFPPKAFPPTVVQRPDSARPDAATARRWQRCDAGAPMVCGGYVCGALPIQFIVPCRLAASFCRLSRSCNLGKQDSVGRNKPVDASTQISGKARPCDTRRSLSDCLVQKRETDRPTVRQPVHLSKTLLRSCVHAHKMTTAASHLDLFPPKRTVKSVCSSLSSPCARVIELPTQTGKESTAPLHTDRDCQSPSPFSNVPAESVSRSLTELPSSATGCPSHRATGPALGAPRKLTYLSLWLTNTRISDE